MAYISEARAGLTDRIRGFFADVNERIARAKLYRTTYNELSSLSSRELADLGLHRSELRRIAYEAAYQN